MGTRVHGQAEPGFEGVTRAFEHCFDALDDVGAAVCVWLDGRVVVDHWGGIADAAANAPWERDTVVPVFSATKGVTATLVLQLVEAGVLDLDRAVAADWPEFAAQGKGEITLRDVLCHRAGLAAVDGTLTLDDVYAWDPVCAAIAAQAPNWKPGTRHGYHARSYGWILGELVRRTTGESAGRRISAQIAQPLGLDLWVGLPAELESRVARLIAPEPSQDPEMITLRERFMGPGTLLARVLSGPSDLFSYGEMWNTREMHAAELPSSNGICDARSLARMYAALVGEVDGVRLLREETLEQARETQVDGMDAVIPMPTRFGLGYMLPPTLNPECGPACFGHAGAGGSLGFGDPARGLAFSYVMNRMRDGITGDERASSLAAATYAALDA